MATAQTPDYTPEYPTISGDFNKRYNRNGFGVSNVEANVGERVRQGVERTLQYTGQRTARIGKQLKEQVLEREAEGRIGVPTAVMKHAGNTLNKTGRIMNVASRGFAFRKGAVDPASARLQVGMAMGWTGLLNALSLATGIIALAALGMTATVQAAIDAIPGFGYVADWVSWMFGATDASALWVVAMATLVLHFFLVITMFAVSYLQLKLGGLQPIHGKASGVKSLVLVGSFVISMIPGANFIPWIWAWLFVVGVFPN